MAAGLWLLVLGVAVVGAAFTGGRAMSWVYLAALVPGVAWAVWLGWRRPARLASVGVYDEATASSVLPGSLVR